jgi:hypothetical protein
MKYFELQPINNRAKSSYNDPAYLDENIMRDQTQEVKNLDLLKVPVQILKSNHKLADFYFPSSDLAMRYMISDRARLLLEKYRNDSIQFYSCPIMHGNYSVKDYWITDKRVYDDDLIDFVKSDFLFIKKKLVSSETESLRKYEKIEQIIKFRDLDDLRVFHKEEMWYMDMLYPHKILLKEDCALHLLTFNETGPFYLIISEHLKKEIIDQKMDKGLEFKPLEIPDEEWYGPNGLRKQFYN